MNVCMRLVVAAVVVCLSNMQAIGFTKFPICTAAGEQVNPRISGNIVVWTDKRGTIDDVYGYNLSTGEEFSIATGAGHQRGAVIENNIVVWTKATGVTDSNIYGKDLSTGITFDVCTAEGDQYDIAIGGGLVVWRDFRNGEGTANLYGKYLSGGDDFLISDGRTSDYATDGDLVIWADNTDGVSNIYGKYLSTGQNIVISDDEPGTQDQPALSGNIVVWHDINDIYGKDLTTDEKFPISTYSGNQFIPRINGDYVVWTDDRNTNAYDIYGYDIISGHDFPIYLSETLAWLPDIDDNLVVWEERVPGGSNIYGAIIPEPWVMGLLAFGCLGLIRRRH